MWLETAKQVTQLNRSPHLDKVSCTRILKARYFSYGAAGRVLSWSKAKSRPYSKPYYLQGTGESLSSLLAHALVLQHIQVPQRTQTPLFQPILRASTFFLFTMLFITILLSDLHAQFRLVCTKAQKRSPSAAGRLQHEETQQDTCQWQGITLQQPLWLQGSTCIP